MILEIGDGMGANNQTLIKEFKGMWYIFTNIMAESWVDWDGEMKEDKMLLANNLRLSEHVAKSPNRDSALVVAQELDNDDPTEYGVHERLFKDNSDVVILDD